MTDRWAGAIEASARRRTDEASLRLRMAAHTVASISLAVEAVELALGRNVEGLAEIERLATELHDALCGVAADLDKDPAP